MTDWPLRLAQLKQHPLFPFRGFLDSPEQYALLEQYWTALFHSVVTDPKWRPYYPVNGAHDGNPIFSSAHDGFRRSVRVIQDADAEQEDDASFGLQPFLTSPAHLSSQSGGPDLELCFLANVSNSTEPWCVRLWTIFCVELAPESAVEAAIRTYEDEVNMPFA